VAVSGNISASGSCKYFDAGGIVGKAHGVNISNCASSVAFSITKTVKANEVRIGGIAGDSSCVNDAYIDKCRYNGILSAVTKYGAVVGGIVGYTQFCEINNCINTGTITGYQAGGIAGYGTSFAKVYNCYNSGRIAGSDKGMGILAIQGSYMDTDSVENCYNFGGVSDRQVSPKADYSYGFSSFSHSVSELPYSSRCPNCGEFDSAGNVTKLNNPIIESCTTLVCALNAWIDKQTDPSMFLRWKEGNKNPAELIYN